MNDKYSNLVESLKNYDVNIQSVYELSTGVQLADLVNQIFYSGANEQLNTKIIKTQQHRKGNNIINLNILLKALKNDPQIKAMPGYKSEVQQLTAFTLMDDEAKMVGFVQWVLKSGQNDHLSLNQSQDRQFDNINLRGSSKQGSPGLENLYFAADISPSRLKSPPVELNDSLDESGGKVVKRGSFKLLRPKSEFKDISQNQEHNSPNPLKEKNREVVSIEAKQRQSSERKTIPKRAQKPPIYRMTNKQNTKNVNHKCDLEKPLFKPPIPTPFNCDSNRSQLSNSSVGTQKNEHIEQLRKNLQNLEKDIKNERESLKKIQKSVSNQKKRIFKVDIKEVSDEDRKQIVHWLISINLLNSVAVNYYSRLHQICKNGVIFPEIINHQKGRGAQLCYFKDPKKSAELNANYQRVFNYLKELPNFSSELMFVYEYFIPATQQKAFWSFLKSMYHCFAKLRKPKQEKALVDYESSIKKRFPRTVNTPTNSKALIQVPATQDLAYDKIKYGSNSKFKERNVMNKAEEKSRCQSQHKQRSSFASKRKASERKIEFIKELPPQTFNVKEQLVQKEEPLESVSYNHGYRDLHQKKNTRKYDTPQKSSSMINTSMSRSRILSMGSVRKSEQKPVPLPVINLDMEMKALCYLKEKGHNSFFNRNDKQLFRDPLRNGVLLNEIIVKDLQINYTFHTGPTNIEQCRQNYNIAISNLKKRVPQLSPGYSQHIEDIIKGEKSLFYGLVSCISSLFNFTFGMKNKSHPLSTISNSNPSEQYTFSYKNSGSVIKVAHEQEISNAFQNEVMMWVRDLEQYSPSISSMRLRDMPNLINSILSANFLYNLVPLLQQKTIITPNYNKPVTQIQQESNLKKILSFFVQNRLLSSEYIQKVRKITKKDVKILQQLFVDLMNLTKSKINNEKSENGTITFVKYLREDQKIKNTATERLDTTMANQSHLPLKTEQEFANPSSRIHQRLKSQDHKQERIELKWMKKLGFSGDLSLNNGVVLCKLIERLTMKTIEGVNSRPQSKAQSLMNIRRAIKAIGGQLKWEQNQILDANCETTLEIYKFVKEKYKNAYALKLSN